MLYELISVGKSLAFFSAENLNDAIRLAVQVIMDLVAKDLENNVLHDEFKSVTISCTSKDTSHVSCSFSVDFGYYEILPHLVCWGHVKKVEDYRLTVGGNKEI